MKWLALLAVCATGSLLIYGVSDFPDWGSANSPANGGVEGAGASISEVFIEETETLTKVPNIVTAVLADYRGYDTMFETVVIFAAGMAIFAIIRVMRDTEQTQDKTQLDSSVDGDHQRIIVGTTCRILIPVIQLFALYVVAHGHHSPGGGFQGGVILGASFILIGLAGNLETAMQRFSEKQFVSMACIGIFIYAGFGLLGQFLGGDFLEYGVLQKVLLTDGEPMARSHSMLGVEIGVALTVTAIMFAIYANLASKGELKNGL
ncbi:MAG: MnhB domain-containing protein [Verrucomicrobiales bacterium]|nr:MnhB domain-containing protein [Verrucomicrobiales bacterium]